MRLIKCMLQESNDIESHGPHKVNSPRDLADSLLAWKFLCDTENPDANYPVPLTLDRICTTHWLITQNQMQEDERGVLRSVNGANVSIGDRMGAKAQVVEDQMVKWLRELHVMSPKEAHIRFEKIHPFIDGNGRIGRMLYYWQLALIGELKPENIIYDKDRFEYYKWF